jgi:hypothetical protein
MWRRPAAARIRCQSPRPGRGLRSSRRDTTKPWPVTGCAGSDPPRAVAVPEPARRTARIAAAISPRVCTIRDSGTPRRSRQPLDNRADNRSTTAQQALDSRCGPTIANFLRTSGCGETGIHAAFRSPCPYGRGGSNPLSRTLDVGRSRPERPERQSQPRSSATRTASPRLRASSFCITEDRWLRTVPGDRNSAAANSATVA